jgi:hypothetical protein
MEKNIIACCTNDLSGGLFGGTQGANFERTLNPNKLVVGTCCIFERGWVMG